VFVAILCTRRGKGFQVERRRQKAILRKNILVFQGLWMAAPTFISFCFHPIPFAPATKMPGKKKKKSGVLCFPTARAHLILRGLGGRKMKLRWKLFVPKSERSMYHPQFGGKGHAECICMQG